MTMSACLTIGSSSLRGIASRGLLFCRAVAAAGDGLRRLYGNNARNLLGETALNKGNGVKEGRVCDAQEVR